MKIQKYYMFCLLIMHGSFLLCSMQEATNDSKKKIAICSKSVHFSDSTKMHSTHKVLNLIKQQPLQKFQQNRLQTTHKTKDYTTYQFDNVPPAVQARKYRDIGHYKNQSYKTSAPLRAVLEQTKPHVALENSEEFKQPALTAFLAKWYADRERRASQDQAVRALSCFEDADAEQK